MQGNTMIKAGVLVALSATVALAWFSPPRMNLGKSDDSNNVDTNYVRVDAKAIVVDTKGKKYFYDGGASGAMSRITSYNVCYTKLLRYILPLHQKFRPYAGAFYRRTFIESPYDDYNIYGARGGVSMILDGSSYASFGWVQEWFDPRITSYNVCYTKLLRQPCQTHHLRHGTFTFRYAARTSCTGAHSHERHGASGADSPASGAGRKPSGHDM